MGNALPPRYKDSVNDCQHSDAGERAAPTLRLKDYILCANEHFTIEHAYYYRVAGFLFVVPTRTVHSLSEMSAPALALLGPTLQQAVRALETTLAPENVYLGKFGESDGTVHFHVFPRTRSLTSAYLKDHGDSDVIDGPRLMTWANAKYLGNHEHGDINATIDSLKAHFRSDA